MWGSNQRKYVVIILDESKATFDGETMEKKEIEILKLFHYFLARCCRVLMMDGDVGEMTLCFAKKRGDLTYMSNQNAKGNKVIRLMLREGQREEQL